MADWGKIREEGLAAFSIGAIPPTIQLPALPHAVTMFLQKSADDAVPLPKLAEIIETDAGLTVSLLKHVNSSFIGLRNKAGNVQQALTLLGRRQSRMFVMVTGTEAATRARKSKLINQNAFWSASLQKALFAKQVAGLLKADTDLAFAGALLQDYLLPVLTNDLFDDYLAFIDDRQNLPQTLCEFEQKKFGWDHALAGACLAHKWSLPDDLVCCILYHHAGLRILADPTLGRSAVAAVALSAMLPEQLRQHYQGLDLLVRLQQKWPAFQLDQLAEAVDRQHSEMGMGVRNDFPLTRRLKRPEDGKPSYEDGTLQLRATG